MTTLEKKEETTNSNQGGTSWAPKIKEGWNSMFLVGCSDNKDHIEWDKQLKFQILPKSNMGCGLLVKLSEIPFTDFYPNFVLVSDSKFCLIDVSYICIFNSCQYFFSLCQQCCLILQHTQCHVIWGINSFLGSSILQVCKSFISGRMIYIQVESL